MKKNDGMKVTVAQAELLRAITSVCGVVANKSTLPILSNVLVEADMASSKMTITATDLDMTVKTSLEAMVQCGGAVTVPAKKLQALTKELNGEIDIEVDDRGVMTIAAQTSNYKLRGLGAEEFPPSPNLTGTEILIPPAKLLDGIRSIGYAQSRDESRYVLNGVFFEFSGQGTLNLVATDGRRLARYTADVPESAKAEWVLPSKAVNELQRILGTLGETKSNVKVIKTDSMVVFEVTTESGDTTTFISKVVEGTYPNYRQVIPPEHKVSIVMDREAALSAIRGAALMTSEKYNSVLLAFTKNRLTITSNSPEVGEGKQEMDLKFDKPDNRISFNPVYILEPFKNRQDNDLTFSMTDELSPATVTSGDKAFTYVIMPMRTSDTAATASATAHTMPPNAGPVFKPEEHQPEPTAAATTATTEPKPKKGKKKNENKPESEPTPAAAVAEPEPATV
jgi:DNA polymerase-3 subunit beta